MKTNTELKELKRKWKKLKNILKANSENWDDTQHDAKKEFKLLVKMMDGRTYGL
jgi:uncharacterized membrane protein